MTIGTMIGIISGAAALAVGSIGALVGSAFNRQILNTIGVDSLPQDPKRKYALIAKHCRFLGEWNRFDSYNVFVFLLGVLFLAGAGALVIIRFEAGGTPFQDTLQLAFLVNSLSWITVSSVLMLGRFVQLVHVYKYGVQPISEEDTTSAPPKETQTKRKHTVYWTVVTAATILFIAGGLLLLKFPVVFIILAACYLLFMLIFNSLYHRSKRQ
ncbi:hypothetical protein [Bacillus atrophaeus]|uniref:DUF3169 family protein n=1 Tax=Bacillus atrophaeus (strain 1942) TaxID=720555 RepID=A0ABM5M0W2_BACA1|nr:hypothetical protein [Bacillus atrophaeus]AMR61546.1 hypothetical protein A1D11_03575 [Bacillus subtilis subsp. globigii]ADP33735.1 hypothetical protein BATR1942_14065 [Bacillus atrophaeus 1942]AIK46432.1 putative membrane protein [Bacillus atrophaeus subsp. globigii]EIM10701.1 hypothetical protein UY9_10812 [Bacillus atrophaeus C89]KFK82026.1 putative membrane protein [Bacillus atrophaeus]